MTNMFSQKVVGLREGDGDAVTELSIKTLIFPRIPNNNRKHFLLVYQNVMLGEAILPSRRLPFGGRNFSSAPSPYWNVIMF